MTIHEPLERSSTDESLRSEREKTDEELLQRSLGLQETAAGVVADARDKADDVLSAAREREDRASDSTPQITIDRAREDAALDTARRGADAAVRDEVEQHRIALASLLAFEREDTDLRLEIERKRADQVMTSREDFMAMVSHDLRSLLGGIALSAELLKEVKITGHPLVQVTHYAERIQRFSARMTRLVGDLVDVASIEAGKLSLQRTRCHVDRLLRDAQDAFGPVAAASGVVLSCTSGDDELGIVDVDHERLLQVLTNLVGNALKFTERGGRIEISAIKHADAVCFSVADTGSGIPAELLEKIFDRYFQSADGDRRGLGLGLFISRSIVEGHGGTIWATSTPGQGTTLFFTVPA